MLIDLHVHSTCSPCSVMTPAEILAHARAKGLDGVCITDHDTMDILAYIKEGFQSDGLFVAVGMEYATAQGDYLVFGDVASLPKGLPAPDMLACVSAVGGVAIAAHPCRVRRPADPVMFRTGLFSLVEVDNGRNSAEENEQAHSLADRYDMVSVAGSDAHRLDELGRCPTRFTVPISSTADLVDALKHGRCLPSVMQCKVA